jgi:hypothetical protein
MASGMAVCTSLACVLVGRASCPFVFAVRSCITNRPILPHSVTSAVRQMSRFLFSQVPASVQWLPAGIQSGTSEQSYGQVGQRSARP